MSVFTLPPEMIIFYKKNIEYITSQAVAPDMRRYASKHEAPRHYIDIDKYGKFPFEEVPRYRTEAWAKFTDVFIITNHNDTLQLFGNEVTHFEEEDIFMFGKGVSHLFDLDTLILEKEQYLSFFQTHFLPQFYKDNWHLGGQYIDTLFSAGLLSDDLLKGDCEKLIATDILSEHGILPWHLEQMYYQLVNAFETRNSKRILRISAELGHYLADAHVPLHTTENYNGQLTGQYGIHGFWESRLPELYADDTYDFFVGKAEYIDEMNPFFWDIILTSHSLLDSVLLIEKDLSKTFSEDKIYCYETRGQSMMRTQCPEYAQAYHERLNGMVERRMRDAILALGSLWYTAWADAGQPDMSNLDKPLPGELEQENKKAEEAAKTKKIIGREH